MHHKKTNSAPVLIVTAVSHPVFSCPIFHRDTQTNLLHDYFMDQSLSQRFLQRKSQLRNQTPISAEEPKVNDPVSHLGTSLFSSGVEGECLIFSGSCQNMMNASTRPALKTCINF